MATRRKTAKGATAGPDDTRRATPTLDIPFATGPAPAAPIGPECFRGSDYPEAVPVSREAVSHTAVRCLAEAHGADWSLYCGDAVHVASQLPAGSVDLNVHSPPFANLYTYSDSALDMGNCVDDAQFLDQYGYLIREQLRITRPGRLAVVHCKDLVDYQSSAGRSGLRDFPGNIVRLYEACNNRCTGCGRWAEEGPRCQRCGGQVWAAPGWKWQSRVTIWKCPVTERARTNAHGLLYKTLRGDGSMTRQGIAETLLVFRRWPETPAETEEAERTRVRHWNPEPKRGEPAEEPAGDPFPLPQWQEWASPVWPDIVQTDVLNVEAAREDKDEKHMCPLQLDLIRRCVILWSNPGDTVHDPFSGIGSTGVVARREGRRFVGSELKRSYFERAAEQIGQVGAQRELFAAASAGG